MEINFLLQEDFERENQKDSIYLQERQMEIEEEFHIPEFGEIEIDYSEIKQIQNEKETSSSI